jgi:hypothetical protein
VTSLSATISFGQYAPAVHIRMVAFQQCSLVWFILRESKMKRSLAKGMSNDVRPRSAAAGYELSPVELDAVHGGALNVEVPAYVPMSQSHPKTEVVLPRIPYK